MSAVVGGRPLHGRWRPDVSRPNGDKKLSIADAVFAVRGGRNIVDEYFTRSDKSNFVDMDVFTAVLPFGSSPASSTFT